MSSPMGNNNREGTRVILREITTTLQNSPPLNTPTKNKTAVDASRTPEHEIKVKFAREFLEVTEEPKSLISNTLSTASSCQSLTSTFSTKSSSGICADSPARSSDVSYTNLDVPGLDDLLSACAGIRLEDSCIDASFLSANDESTTDVTLNLPADVTGDFNGEEFNKSQESFILQLDETREIRELNLDRTVQLNETVNFTENPSVVPDVEVKLTPDKSGNLSALSLPGNTTGESLSETVVVVEPPRELKADSEVSLPVSEETFSVEVGQEVCNSSSFVKLDEEKLIVSEEKSGVNLNKTVELSEPLVCNSSFVKLEEEKLIVDVPEKKSGVELNQTVELPEPLVCNSSFVKLEEEKLIADVAVEKSVVGLNQTVELSEPLLIKQDQDCEPPIVESEEEPVIKNNSYNALDRTLTLSELEELYPETANVEDFDPKAENVEELIQRENTPSPGIVDYQNFTPQRQSTSINLDETFDSALGDAEGTEETFVTEAPVGEEAKKTFVKEVSASEEEEKIVKEGINSEKAEETTTENPENTLHVNDTFLADLKVDSADAVCNFDAVKSEAQRLADDLYNTSLACVDDNEEFVPASSDLFPDLMSVDLSNFNSGNTAVSNDRLRSESLYVKFDPLVSNTSMLPQGGNIVAAPSSNNDEKINGDKDIVHNTPKKNPAIDAIDRLLFYSPLPDSTIKKNEEPEKIEHRDKTPEPAPVIDSTMAKELELVRSTVLQLEEQIERQKINHDSEKKKLQDDKIKAEKEIDSLHAKISLLKKELSQEIKSKNQITVVVDEYEKSISRLVAEKERDRTSYDVEKSRLYEELQDAKHHLTATEAAFNDVHAKYEKLKIVVTESRHNEQVLKESVQENIEIIKSLEHRYEQIKSHAAARLEKANYDLDTIRKQHESDNVKLRAMLRKEELKSNSLAEMVEQKTKENKELTQILDEVIARVGPKAD